MLQCSELEQFLALSILKLFVAYTFTCTKLTDLITYVYLTIKFFYPSPHAVWQKFTGTRKKTFIIAFEKSL